MNFATIKNILALLPVLIEAIKAIEAAMPAKGQGAAKLEAVREIVATAYTMAGGALDAFASLWPALQAITASIVKMFNTSGQFAK